MRSGGRYSGRFATTVDYVAKKARIDRGDKADLIDNEGFEGRPTIRQPGKQGWEWAVEGSAPAGLRAGQGAWEKRRGQRDGVSRRRKAIAL